MQTRLICSALTGVLALIATACGSDTPVNADLLDLRVFQVARDAGDSDRDPYLGVSFMRLIAADDSDVLTDKFVNYEEGIARALDDIPFGENIQLTIEGWSRNPQNGLIGQVVSRGRSKRLNLTADSAAVTVNIPFARVNTFSRTSTPGTAGAEATQLAQGRVGHSVTVLADGRVLIAGGYVPVAGNSGDFKSLDDVQQVLASAEIYDPDTGQFSPAGGSMSIGRAFHSTILLGNQAVLFIGGISAGNTATPSMEVYEPFQNVFIPLEVGLRTSRFGHTLTQLDTAGHLLISGGFTAPGGAMTALTSAEVLCAPKSPCEETSGAGVLDLEFNMQQARGFHTATRVDVGQSGDTEAVVMIGGEGNAGALSTLETFVINPAQFTQAAPVEMVGGARTRHSANYIHSQRFIHVVGGFSDKDHVAPVQRIDSYQVQQQAFHTGKEFYSLTARGGHGSANIGNNAIVLFGGFDANGPMSTAEVIYEYQDLDQQKTFIDRGGVGAMVEKRGGGVGVLLDNGTVLTVGGVSGAGALNRNGEFFNPL
jgi:hypothetical protein